MKCYDYSVLGALLHNILSSLCNDSVDNKPKIYLALSEFDLGAGTTTLWLTKHFGVYPVELDGVNGEINTDLIRDISSDTRTTLLFQAFPLFENFSSSYNLDTITSILESDAHVLAHLPKLAGLRNKESIIMSELMDIEVVKISKHLLSLQHHNLGPIVYISGFNIIMGSNCKPNMAPVSFLPWYLLTLTPDTPAKIYHPLKISTFLSGFSPINPDIKNLDSLFQDEQHES